MTCTRTINVRGSSHSGHYCRLFSPNCPLVVAVQCSSRQGHTHAAARRTFVRVPHAHARPTCPLARTYMLTYTTVHLPPQRHAAILCGRTLGSPDLRSRRRPSSSLLLLPSRARRLRTHLPAQYRGTPCRARRAKHNRISKSRCLLEKETWESRGFPARDRGSGIDRLKK